MTQRVSITNVLDILENGDQSDVDMLSESDDEELFSDRDEHTEDSSSSDDSDTYADSSDDDVPLATLQHKALTPPNSYSWQSTPFKPPDDVKFHGDTDLHDLSAASPTETTPYAFLKRFISHDMLQMVADQTNIYSVEKDGKAVNTSPQEIEQMLGITCTWAWSRCRTFAHTGSVRQDTIRWPM